MASEVDELARAGIDAYERGEYAVELEIWKKVAVLDPDDPHWQSNLAQAFANVGKFEQAAILFQYAMSLPRPPSAAFNNYVAMLATLGAPTSELLPLIVLALEASEGYDYFQRHLANLAAAVALADRPADEVVWSTVRERALAFLERHNDRTPEHENFVKRCITAYANYQPFKVALAQQDWSAASHALSHLELIFSGSEFEKVELARIRAFRPLLETAAEFLALLDKVGSGVGLQPSELLECLAKLREQLIAAASNSGSYGSHTFLDLVGWSMAELMRQCRWLAAPSSIYDADAHATPNAQLAALSRTPYAELGEMLQATLLCSNRTMRRTSQRLGIIRSPVEREEALSKAWQAFRMTAHAIASEYRGVSTHLTREMLGWNIAPRDRLMRDVERFRSFIESRAHQDLFVHGKPYEQIARALLLAFLKERGFAEVPLRGGRVDILAVTRDAISIIEVKIWRGPRTYLDGLAELREYVAANAVPGLASSLYLVLDPTAAKRARKYIDSLARPEGIDVVVVDIRPQAPSKMGIVDRQRQREEAP